MFALSPSKVVAHMGPGGWLVPCVLLGTIVRGWFGWSAQLWNGAPDQGAWDLALQDVTVHGLHSYQQLLHYPHEGGTLLLSLLGLAMAPLADIMPPLSWVALVLDTLVRYAQIRWTRVLFGELTAQWFGWWTILSVPLLLPWATVNFGLHALMAFAPFALLLALKRGPVVLGLLLGVLASMAYDVWALSPALGLYVVLSGGRPVDALGRLFKFIAAALLAFLPHMLVRLLVDHGFGLEAWSAYSIRGMGTDLVALSEVPGRFYRTWVDVLPASFTLGPVSDGLVRIASLCALGFMLLAGYFSLRRGVSEGRWALVMLVSFSAALAFLPLYDVRSAGSGIIYYRYMPFVVPLVAVMVIHGLCESGRWWKPLVLVWTFFCGGLSVAYMVRCEPIGKPNTEAIGWVLARKYGDDPGTLVRLSERLEPSLHPAFFRGCGWGTTAALFANRTAPDTIAVAHITELITRYPAAYRSSVQEGALRAFDTEVTPHLDRGFVRSLQLEKVHP